MLDNTHRKMNAAIRHAEAERRWQELYARRHNFFWMPCPNCGVEFSGAEWRDMNGKVSSIPDPDRRNVSIGICPSCTQAGRGFQRHALPASTPSKDNQ